MLKCLLLGILLLAVPLAAEVKVLAFAGSTRKDSYNKKLIQESAKMARQMGATVTVVDLKDYPIPLYDGDLEKDQGMPENAKKIRNMMKESQAIIIASPEYNGSISAVLKNVLDWASREDGKSSRAAFKGKKIAIMSTTPGSGGGVRALEDLRKIIQSIGGSVIATQVAVPSSSSAFDPNGGLVNQEKKKELEQAIKQLLQP